MLVYFNNKPIHVRKGSKISYLITDNKFYYKALVDNELVDLDYRLNKENQRVFLLDLKDRNVMRCYESTLRFLFLYSLYELKLPLNVRFNYTISRALFAYMDNGLEYINKIDSKMRSIIKKGLKIKKNQDGYYELNGFKLKMHFDLLSDTRMVKRFKLYPVYPGIIIQFPRSELNGNIPILSDSLKYFKGLNQSLKTVINDDIDNIDKLNKAIKNHKFVDECELRFKENVEVIIDEVLSKKKKVISITGPSSSGKTTLATLINNSLTKKGYNTLLVSIDDYYLSRENIPMKDGKYDFETTEAFDYEGLSSDLQALLNNELVNLKTYDFKTKKSARNNPKQITNDTIIILEGIHALNDKFSSTIDRKLKYKVFISPQCLINIDDYNPIPISDIRLLRRAIRDHKHRGAGIVDTLDMWQNVRTGEYKWIYPFQDDSDYTFNTFLPYELNVIKHQALELIKSVKFGKYAYRLRKLEDLLNKFDDLPESIVPNDSILKEFL